MRRTGASKRLLNLKAPRDTSASATSLYSRFDPVYFTLSLPPRVLVLHIGVGEGPIGFVRALSRARAEGFAEDLGKGSDFSMCSTVAHS